MADDLGFVSTADHSDLGFEPHPSAVPIGQQPASIPGVATVMAGQAGRALGAAGEWLNPMNFVNLALHPYESTVGASARSLDAAGTARRQGQYGEAALHALGALPLVGPPSEQLIRDVGQGNLPEAVGHAGAAYLLGRLPEAPGAISEAAKTAKTVTKAGTEAAKTTKASKMGAAVGGFTGAGIGQALGHPFIGGDIGAAVGGAYPKVVAGTKAAAKAYRGMGKPTPPPAVDYTMGGPELSIPGVGPKPPTPPPPVPTPPVDYTMGTGELSIPGVGPRPSVVAGPEPIPPPPIDYTMGTGELSIPGMGARPRIVELPPEIPEGLRRSMEAFPTGGSGGVAKQFRRKVGSSEPEYSPASQRRTRTPGAAGMESLVPPPTPPPPSGLTIREGISSGPITPVEPLNVQGGVMPPAPEGTLQPPKPPAPLPPPPKLLPTAAERDAMAAAKMREARIAKDVKLAQYLKDQGLDAAAVRKLSDADLNAHLKAAGMPSSPKTPSSTGWHRSIDEVREHVAQRLEGRQ